ncbi:MAG: hypothetical protein M3Z06_07190 [Actinomycetota bacterium]|nr:hypothetical protein [Actinomycetota bacterium]
MSRRALLLAGVAFTLAGAVPAVSGADTTTAAKSITATGASQVKVVPKDRQSNASIVAAVNAAEKVGIPAAVSSAHALALSYAAAAHLKLGAVLSVSDVQSNGGFIGPYGGSSFVGPFGPNKYCGTVRRGVFKVVGKRRKLVRIKKVHRCIVPPYQTIQLSVTYSAT